MHKNRCWKIKENIFLRACLVVNIIYITRNIPKYRKKFRKK